MRLPSLLQPRYVSRFRLPLGLLLFTIGYEPIRPINLQDEPATLPLIVHRD